MSNSQTQQIKQYNGSVNELKLELQSRGLVVKGRKAVLKERLIEHDKHKHIEFGKEAPNMGGWGDIEVPYEGSTINETIKPGDHLTFGYCNVANHSETTSRTEHVIEVRAATNGT